MKIDGEYQSSEVYTPLFEMFNIFYAKVLFKGTLKECLEYPNEYNSTIPAQLNETAPEVNICEGNVVKPIIPKFMGDHRVILKNKNEKWSEKANEKKNGNTPKQDISLTEEENEILNNLLQYNTENRLKNVLSKVGEVSTKDFGKVMGELMQDIYDDFKKEFNVDLKTLTKQVKNKLQNEVSSLIRKNWVNILDKIF